MVKRKTPDYDYKKRRNVLKQKRRIQSPPIYTPSPPNATLSPPRAPVKSSSTMENMVSRNQSSSLLRSSLERLRRAVSYDDDNDDDLSPMMHPRISPSLLPSRSQSPPMNADLLRQIRQGIPLRSKTLSTRKVSPTNNLNVLTDAFEKTSPFIRTIKIDDDDQIDW